MIAYLCHVGPTELNSLPWEEFCALCMFAKEWSESQAEIAKNAKR